MNQLTENELLFFSRKPEALPLYACLRERILEAADVTQIQVKKTQISFKNRHIFAAVSFLPVRRAAERPAVCITLTVGLWQKLDSPRVDAAVEVRPNRWTHHFLLSNADEIDEELLSWVAEAAALAGLKR